LPRLNRPAQWNESLTWIDLRPPPQKNGRELQHVPSPPTSEKVGDIGSGGAVGEIDRAVCLTGRQGMFCGVWHILRDALGSTRIRCTIAFPAIEEGEKFQFFEEEDNHGGTKEFLRKASGRGARKSHENWIA